MKGNSSCNKRLSHIYSFVESLDSIRLKIEDNLSTLNEKWNYFAILIEVGLIIEDKFCIKLDNNPLFNKIGDDLNTTVSCLIDVIFEIKRENNKLLTRKTVEDVILEMLNTMSVDSNTSINSEIKIINLELKK